MRLKRLLYALFLVLTFSFIILRNMSNSYFHSELRMANKTVQDRGKDTDEGLYQHMQKIDHVLNDFNPLVPKKEVGKARSIFKAYNIIIDSVGNYVYHPDKDRVRKRNFKSLLVKRFLGESGKGVEHIVYATYNCVGFFA